MNGLAPAASLDIGALVTQLGGGLALFLFGMRLMTEALKTVSGKGMKNLMARLTTNRFTGALAGALVTAVVQSSSVTTVLVVGFVSAGLLNLTQSIGVIMGANVGTTITAQIIAFQVYKYGLLMIAIGFFLEVLARRETPRQWGVAIMGLGLIFFGMQLMSLGTEPLREWPPFINAMQSISNPLLCILIGAIFTAMVQSSSATTGIVIVLASQGLVTLETSIGLILGSNIGTCVTAFISAVGRPRTAMQAAWVHIIFNVGGVLLWLLFIPQLAELARSMSPYSHTLADGTVANVDLARQIANAHTVFNVANLFLFIWFTGPLGRLVTYLIPAEAETGKVKAKYLDDFYLSQPALALDQARRELSRMGTHVQAMMAQSLRVTAQGTHAEVAALVKADDEIDAIYENTIRFLGKLTQKNLVQSQPEDVSSLVAIANYLENIGDIIEIDLMDTAEKRIRNGMALSDGTYEILQTLSAEVERSFARALSALETGEVEQAIKAVEGKSAINDLAKEASKHLAQRLVVEEPGRLEAFQIESDIIENYRRIDTNTRRIARLCIKLNPAKKDAED